jgi:ribosome-associated protein
MINNSQTRIASPSSTVATSANSATTHEQDSYRLASIIAQAADDRKGNDIVLLNVSEISYIADYFVIITGFSNVQVRAIARSIEDKVEAELHRLPLQTEGQTEGSWILLDYGDVIAHIFLPQQREFYGLEAFWGHAEQIPFSVSQMARD